MNFPMSNRKRNRNFAFSSLNTQLFFFVILPISILLLFVTFGSITLHQGAMRNLVGVRDQRTVSSAANAINEKLHHRSAAIRGVAIRAEESEDYAEILTSVEFLLADFDYGVALLDPSGENLSYVGDDEKWGRIGPQISEHTEIGNRDYTNGPIFSRPVHDKDEYLTLVHYQLNPDAPIAIGIFSVHKMAAQTLAGSLTYDNKGTVILVDQEQTLLFQSGHLDLANDPESHPGVSEALSGESGTTYFRAEDGEHVVAYSPVGSIGWGLVIEEPWATVANPLLRYTETGSLVLVPIVIFALFALWFGTRQIIQPLAHFRKQAEAFSQGNYQAFDEDVGGINEISVLHTTFVEMAAEVEAAQHTLKRFLGLVTTGQEEERKRLARELHDDTLQSLIALNQRVMMVRRSAKNIGLDESLAEIEEMISQTMAELRRLTRALRPIYLEDLGLVTALHTMAQEMSQSSDIKIQFQPNGEEKRLTDNIEIALFRISQEALSNILRHSEATEAAVEINFHQSEVQLEILDNGKGFIPPDNPSALSNLGHFGLLGIYERAELIGAQIVVESELGKGTKIILKIPT